MSDSPRIEELKRRVQLDPASIAFAALAEEYRRAGRHAEAIEVCKAGLQRHPSYISAHVTLGRALFEVGEYEEAREELEYVLRVAPENLAAIRGLAEIHHRLGQLPEAEGLTVAPELMLPPPPAPPVAMSTPVVPSRVEDPALPALEEFLAAILRARQATDNTDNTGNTGNTGNTHNTGNTDNAGNAGNTASYA